MKIKKTISNLAIYAGIFTLSYVSLTTLMPSIAFAQNTKVTQCDLVINIANEAVTATQSATSDEGEDELQALLTATNLIDEAANDMANLPLNDDTLNGYRQEFIAMYRQTSLMTRRFIDAFTAENREAAFAALDGLQVATEVEDRLVTELNRYCDRT
ncbi:hypothetical protein [Spirulina sp. 06S082]|uniref:hypothetical protein n=1 Tax=Spirulina sp. 06S082 TaxID=3110248 RepID=UPI002B1EC64B|nr:hypothetical protein [Spirulina sp. 06S082]MEA5467355.1 hypothetical protein [Spirulina sp. 06S082]